MNLFYIFLFKDNLDPILLKNFTIFYIKKTLKEKETENYERITENKLLKELKLEIKDKLNLSIFADDYDYDNDNDILLNRNYYKNIFNIKKKLQLQLRFSKSKFLRI
jgi:hypothetical protein